MIRAYFLVGTQSSTHMSVSVQTPPSNASLYANNSISEVQNITIDYQPIFEKMEITLDNVESGTYSMQMNNRIRTNLKYNMDAGSMAWTLDRFGVFTGSSVVLQKLDSNGKETVNSSLIVSYKYIISFKHYRYDSVGMKPFIITSGLKPIIGKKISTTISIT